MKHEVKRNDDGSLLLTTVISKEELANIQSAQAERNEKGSEPTLPEGAEKSWRWRPTTYCVTCNIDDSKHEISAYGDIDAVAQGAFICPLGGYGVHAGGC